MKTLKIAILALVLLFMVACGSKIPFKKQQPLENAALVYIYVPDAVTAAEDTQTYTYTIRINNKKYKDRITEGEYLSLNLKPITMDISATRGEVEEHKINIHLEAGKTYYFKIQKQHDLSFTFERVENSIALGEIAKTGLAGSMVDDASNIITEFVNPKEDKKEDVLVKQAQTTESPKAQSVTPPPPVVTPTTTSSTKRIIASKLDEIKKAYEMKKEGIISDDEFKTIKSEILAK